MPIGASFVFRRRKLDDDGNGGVINEKGKMLHKEMEDNKAE